MDEPEGNAETVSQAECKKNCPCSPKPNGYQEPSYPGENIYDKISKDQKDEIDSKYKTALWTGDQVHSKSIIDAETAKATAKAANDVAMKKSDSAVEILKQKVTLEKEKILLVYKKCLRDALSNTCKNIETDVPGDKKAICIAQLIQGMSEQDVEYQKEIQKICQERADAERAWANAKQQYNAAICNANAIKEEVVYAAQIERRKELSVALQAVCNV